MTSETTSAVRSGTPRNISRQLASTCMWPSKPRLGCAGCSLRYSGANSAAIRSASCAFMTSRSFEMVVFIAAPDVVPRQG